MAANKYMAANIYTYTISRQQSRKCSCGKQGHAQELTHAVSVCHSATVMEHIYWIAHKCQRQAALQQLRQHMRTSGSWSVQTNMTADVWYIHLLSYFDT